MVVHALNKPRDRDAYGILERCQQMLPVTRRSVNKGGKMQDAGPVLNRGMSDRNGALGDLKAPRRMVIGSPGGWLLTKGWRAVIMS